MPARGFRAVSVALLMALLMASEAATTGPVIMVVNGSTSSMMTCAYEYAWRGSCKVPSDENGVVPISVRKAAIYRGLSILRVGGLAPIFGNTLGSSALVTTAITVSRTTVCIPNDMLWFEIDKRPPVEGDGTAVAQLRSAGARQAVAGRASSA